MPRPRNAIQREKVLYAPVTEGEHREILAAAGLRGAAMGEFVRISALEAARKLLRKMAREGGKLPKSLPDKDLDLREKSIK